MMANIFNATKLVNFLENYALVIVFFHIFLKLLNLLVNAGGPLARVLLEAGNDLYDLAIGHNSPSESAKRFQWDGRGVLPFRWF